MSAFSTETLQGLGLAPPPPTSRGSNNQLGQSDFLRLMTQQLAQQDPFEPLDNGDFIAQMAQFSTLTGIETLTESFGVLARTLSQGQSLQAASLVGRNVLVPTDSSEIAEGGTVSGAIDLDNPEQTLRIEVVDAAGATVATIELSDTRAGLNDFHWDGLLADGSPAPAGTYEFRATAAGAGSTQAVPVYLEAAVNSVTVDERGRLLIEVVGLGTIEFEQIRRIGQ